jgi:hypothetical protein
MSRLRTLAAGAVFCALAFIAGAFAQTGIISLTLTGKEVVVAATGGPGGPSIFVPIEELRGAAGYATTTTATGTTPAAITSNNANTRVYYTAALSGGVTHNSPPAPYDGQMLEIVNGTGSAFTQTITLTASGTQTVNSGAVATLAAGSSAEWQYNATTTTWLRVR